jgi:hypothetical protein
MPIASGRVSLRLKYTQSLPQDEPRATTPPAQARGRPGGDLRGAEARRARAWRVYSRASRTYSPSLFDRSDRAKPGSGGSLTAHGLVRAPKGVGFSRPPLHEPWGLPRAWAGRPPSQRAAELAVRPSDKLNRHSPPHPPPASGRAGRLTPGWRHGAAGIARRGRGRGTGPRQRGR